MLAKLSDLGNDLFGVSGISGLCHLQQDLAEGKTVLLNQFDQLVHQMRIIHIDAGDIDGNRDGDVLVLSPGPDLPGYLLPHIVVQRLNETVLLKDRDKYAGTDHAKRRMLPAHKRFRAD